jgi:hypothetical protein
MSKRKIIHFFQFKKKFSSYLHTFKVQFILTLLNLTLRAVFFTAKIFPLDLMGLLREKLITLLLLNIKEHIRLPIIDTYNGIWFNKIDILLFIFHHYHKNAKKLKY